MSLNLPFVAGCSDAFSPFLYLVRALTEANMAWLRYRYEGFRLCLSRLLAAFVLIPVAKDSRRKIYGEKFTSQIGPLTDPAGWT
jgi:hypothetical protein